MHFPPKSHFVGRRFLVYFFAAAIALAVSALWQGRSVYSEHQQLAENESSNSGIAVLTPTPYTTSVRPTSVFGNNLVYEPVSQKLYMSVPSNMGSPLGNRIARIDPVSGNVESSVFIGSEPDLLRLASDNHTLYVSLDGASAIRKFDVNTQIAGPQFSIGIDSSRGPLLITDFDIDPTAPDTVAVARYQANDAVFDSGIQRPNVGGYSRSVAFSADASVLYGAYSFPEEHKLEVMPVTTQGIGATTYVPFDAGTVIKLYNGLIYSNRGQVIDPVSHAIVGTYPLGGAVANTSAFVIDREHDLIFFLIRDSQLEVQAFDLTDFTFVGSITTPSVGNATDIKRWGVNGLAISNGDGPLLLIQSTLVDPVAPVPTFTPTPTPSPTATPTPPSIFIRRIDQLTNDIRYNSADGKLYASVPGAGLNGTANSITRIDPISGAVDYSVPIGSEPYRVAISDDGTTLYVGLNTANAIRKFDIATQTAGLQFPTQLEFIVRDLAVQPGNPETVVAGAGQGGAAIYDNGVKRPNVPADLNRGGLAWIGAVEFAESPDVLYGFNNVSTGYELYTVNVNDNGLDTSSQVSNLIYGFSPNIQYAGGRLFTPPGRVVVPGNSSVAGTFVVPTFATAMAVDPVIRRVFIANAGVIFVYDMDTYLRIGAIPYPNTGGIPSDLVRWGVNGLALRTDNGTHGYLNLIQSDLVSTAASVPTGINLSSTIYTATEGGPSASITVRRNGDLSSTSTVQFRTIDGTAISGVDYAPVSGTLTFAPGQSIRSIFVPIFNDDVFELDETFDVEISNPTGPNVTLLPPASATVRISDDDQRPNISTQNISVNEPAIGYITTVDIPVRLSNPSSETVSVVYATADGTATAGSDYLSASGVLTFAPLETIKSVPIAIIGDGINEPAENFLLRLSAPSNGTIGNGVATITIADHVPPRTNIFDYDGDNRSDISVYRPAAGNWYLQQSTAGFFGTNFGIATDTITPADYDGDGKTDISVYRPETGIWYVVNSSNGTVSYFNFGIAEDLPTPADYDGDGRADFSVFRPSTATWYRQNSSDGSFYAIQFGASEDKPTVGDFDGDGHADIAIFRPSVGAWYQLNSSNNQVTGEQFGFDTDVITPADYDGDGKTDLAVFRPSNGFWYIRNSNGPVYTAYPFGLSTDIPAAGDFDGDGKADLSVFRPSDGTWYRMNSSDGSFFAYPFGTNGDKPTQTAFRY